APTETQILGYLNRLLPPGDFLRFGVIDIVANLPGAAVTVGGAARGLTPIEALKLPAPASYDIRVEKADYVPFTTRVALPPGGEVRVGAELVGAGGGAGAWSQHWYVLAGAGVIVAAAGGPALYFGPRPTTIPAPPGDGTLHVTGSIH